MGSERKRFQCEATGLGSSRGLRLRLEKCWRTRKWSVLKCAPIQIAAGFSTIRPRPGPSAGATTVPAVTAPASAARGQHKNENRDEQDPAFARRAVHSLELNLGVLAAHKSEKFVARLLIVTESAEHSTGNCRTVLLLHAAHLHTQMAGFDDYADTLRSDFFLDGLRDLTGHALLDLQAAGKPIDHPPHLSNPQYTLVPPVGNGGLAEERQQVMCA